MAEPLADNLGSLALDSLLQDAGWRRAVPDPVLPPVPLVAPPRRQ